MPKMPVHAEQPDLDWARFAEAIRQHITDLQAALAAVERIMAWTGPAEIAGVPALGSHGGTLDPTGVAAAAPLWANCYATIRDYGKPMSVGALAEALKENGVASKAADFPNTLNSIMTKRQDLFHRAASKVWGLTEWEIFPQGRIQPLRSAGKGMGTMGDRGPKVP